MTVTIGQLTFDHVVYDDEADVLYLNIGEPREAAYADTTPEGHALRYDEDGELLGVTLINARWITEREGEIVITLPAPSHVPAKEIEPALAGAR